VGIPWVFPGVAHFVKVKDEFAKVLWYPRVPRVSYGSTLGKSKYREYIFKTSAAAEKHYEKSANNGNIAI
jgi:hypothetical protein